MKTLEQIIFKTLVSTLLTLLTLIVIKQNPNYKEMIHYQIYEKSISFSKINKEYQKYFGSPIPLSNLIKEDEKVFTEKIEYQEINKYFEGAKLKVNNEYLIPSLSDGIVIYIGEKENYNQTIIIEDSNGIDRWYGNLENVNVKLYDYVKKGTYIGSANNELYLIFKKNGKILNYNEYI